jgi:hypothetical protein
MIKKFCFVLAALLVAFAAHSKEEYSSLKEVACQKALAQIERKFSGKEYQMIVYGKNSGNHFKGEVVLVDCEGKIAYWYLKSDTLLSKGCLGSDRIFKYKSIKMTGVRKKEEFSAGTYVPPIYTGVDNEYVVYRDSASAFHYEYGKYNCFYKPDAKYDKYRREWLDIIRMDLSHLLK